MRASYDSEADALSIDLLAVDRWHTGDQIDDTYCSVALANGRPANVELIAPLDHLDLLATVARRYSLDGDELAAVARAALAAPDRSVAVAVAG